MTSDTENNVDYGQRTRGPLPGAFQKYQGSMNVSSRGNFSELDLNFNGNVDYAMVTARNLEDQSGDWYIWQFVLPDTLNSFSVPKITDRDIIHKEKLMIYTAEAYDHENMNGYGDYLNSLLFSTDKATGTTLYKRKYFQDQAHIKSVAGGQREENRPEWRFGRP